MAITVERMVAVLEARLDKYEKGLARAYGQTDRQFTAIERRGKQMEQRLSHLGGTFKTFTGGLLAGAAGAFSIEGVRQLLDGATRIKNALKATGLEGEALTKVYDKLYASAQKNGAPIESLVTLYSKLSLTSGELGVSQEQLLTFTDQIGTALRAGGVSAQQASGALLQLSQALGSGVVRAEEFNSILEGAPIILQQAAAGLKEAEGSVAKLRTLMLDAQLSSKAFFDAFIAGAPATQEKVATAESTISQAFVRLQNVLQDSAVKFNETTGATESLAEFMNGPLTTAIEDIARLLNHLSSGPIPTFFNSIGDGIDWVVQKFADLGAALGTDRLGGNPYIGPGRIQNRINDAFAGAPTPARTTQKTGRLGTTSSTNINPVTLADYEVPASAKKKGGKAGTSEAERAAKKAAEDLDRAIASQTGIAVDVVTGLLGQHEKKNAASINAFLKAGGVDLNAATTAWCAAFVNSALAQVGVTGSGSNIATNFANWGTSVDASKVQRGDVMVQMRGKQVGETGGHVGFATGQVRVRQGILELQQISGNASNQVKEEWIAASDTIVRRATEAMQLPADGLRNLSEESQAAIKASEEALKNQQTIAEQLGDVMQTVFNGLATALSDGKIEAQELLSIVLQVAQQLLTMNLAKGGKGAGGGILGTILGGILGMADGGRIRGPGTGRSDSIPIMASNGEYMVNAAATRKYLPLLEAINSGRVMKLASGGLISSNNFRLPDLRDSVASQGRNSQRSTYVINAPINAPGADRAALMQLRKAVDDLGRNIPSMIDLRTRERDTRRTRASWHRGNTR